MTLSEREIESINAAARDSNRLHWRSKVAPQLMAAALSQGAHYGTHETYARNIVKLTDALWAALNE